MKLKSKLLLSCVFLGSSILSFAQGYLDGIEYYKVEQLDRAKELLDRNINDAATNKAESYYYLGQIARDMKKYDEAKAAFEKGISLDDKSALNYVGLGTLDLINKNQKAAEGNFDAAQDLVKKSKDKRLFSSVMTEIARAYYNAGISYEKYLEQAKKKDISNPEIYMLEGDIFNDKKEYGEAATKYEMAITFSKTYQPAYVKYAHTYYYVNPKVAIEKMVELNNNAPQSALAQRELAEIYYRNNQFTNATNAYEKYMKNPNAFAYDRSRLAVLLYFCERYDDALALADKILASTPNDFQMKRIEFLSYNAKKDYTKAAEKAGEFFALKGDFTANDYTTYSNVLKNLDRKDEAVAEFEKAVALDNANNDLYKDLAKMYLSAGKYDKAVNTYKKFIEGQGDNVKVNDYYTLADYQTTAAGKATDEAERAAYVKEGLVNADKVIEAAPENYMGYELKAGLEAIAKSDNAEATLTKMLSVLDANGGVAENKGAYVNAYQQLGLYWYNKKDYAKTKSYWGKVLTIDPENAVKKYIEMLK